MVNTHRLNFSDENKKMFWRLLKYLLFIALFVTVILVVFGSFYVTLLMGLISIGIATIAFWIAESSDKKIDSIMNAHFVSIIGSIEQRNLVINAVVNENAGNLTGLLWITREEINGLDELMKHKILDKNYKKLTNRFNGLLKRLSSNNYMLNSFRYEDVKHVLWMEMFILEHICSSLFEGDGYLNEEGLNPLEETKTHIQKILRFENPITIDVNNIQKLLGLINKDNRWKNYNSNTFEELYTNIADTE